MGVAKINTLRDFLLAYQESLAGQVMYETGGFHYPYAGIAYGWEVDAELVENMVRLGLLYPDTGGLDVNRMGMRLLEEMHHEGKELTEPEVRREIEADRESYHAGLFELRSLLENSQN